MSLALHWKNALEGNVVTFKPRGQSMRGLIESGSQVEVSPCHTDRLEVDDIVLVKVKGNIYLHKILAIDGNRYLIGNNRGGTNGWTSGEKIAGLCTKVGGVSRPNISGKTI